jgi:hypothetical protein
MTRHVLTDEDRAYGVLVRQGVSESAKLRRLAEKALLNRLLAERAMPDWYRDE